MRRTGFLVLGTVITVTQLVRVPSTVLISLIGGAGVWWLFRRRHSRAPLHRARRKRHLRRQVVSAGLTTAGLWLAFMVLLSSYELGDMLTSPDGGVTGFDGFPGRPLLEGLLSTTGVTYLALALAEKPSRRHRRRIASKREELAGVSPGAPDDT